MNAGLQFAASKVNVMKDRRQKLTVQQHRFAAIILHVNVLSDAVLNTLLAAGRFAADLHSNLRRFEQAPPDQHTTQGISACDARIQAVSYFCCGDAST